MLLGELNISTSEENIPEVLMQAAENGQLLNNLQIPDDQDDSSDFELLVFQEKE